MASVRNVAAELLGQLSGGELLATNESWVSRADEGHDYTMAFTGSGLFVLLERIDGTDKPLSENLSLDDSFGWWIPWDQKRFPGLPRAKPPS